MREDVRNPCDAEDAVRLCLFPRLRPLSRNLLCLCSRALLFSEDPEGCQCDSYSWPFTSPSLPPFFFEEEGKQQYKPQHASSDHAQHHSFTSPHRTAATPCRSAPQGPQQTTLPRTTSYHTVPHLTTADCHMTNNHLLHHATPRYQTHTNTHTNTHTLTNTHHSTLEGYM